MLTYFGLDPVVVEEPAGAEADHVAADVADRPEQPGHEPVDRAAALALAGQARRDQLLGGEPAAEQVLGEAVPVARGEADAERLGRGLVEAALGQELPPGDGRRGCQLLDVELRGRPVGLDEAGALAGLPVGRRAALVVPEGDAVARGQPLDRLGEGQVVDLHHERDDVAALLAAEAVEGPDAAGGPRTTGSSRRGRGRGP